MAIYRTAQGRMVDMAALASKNEKTRAVGNMKVNARGDVIDRDGNIIQPVNEKTNDQYAKTVGSRSAQAPRQVKGSTPVRANSTSKVKTPPRGQLTEAELELEDSLNDDIEIEKIKEKEVRKKK